MDKNFDGFKRGFVESGTPFIWASGMAAVILIFMLVGMVTLIILKGMGHFWPADIVQTEMKDGRSYLGRVMEDEKAKDFSDKSTYSRTLYKIGNRDLYGLDFKWLDDREVVKQTTPGKAVVVERSEYGDFIGFIKGIKVGEELTPESTPGFNKVLKDKMTEASDLVTLVDSLRNELEALRQPVHGVEVEIQQLTSTLEALTADEKEMLAKLEAERKRLIDKLDKEIAPVEERLGTARQTLAQNRLVLEDVSGRVKEMALKDVVRIYYPNTMGTFSKTWHYASKVHEFIFEWPRESNTEGGIWPAIYGTVLMVIIMVLITTPLGVMTAVYMQEYAKPGPLLNLLRLSVNNLAGVPSIVFGIFGLGFFIYFVGGGIDRFFFSDNLPNPTFGTGGILWASLTLALLTVPVMVVSTEEGLSAVPRANRDGALALGASKFQMLWKIVLPNAMPGILTGVILAVSRGAGEVAPLMITGVVKLASSLPIDASWPFIHLERKFMHLGFHIYDVGFQSPNVEAAKPMVYTTTLLLLLIILALNLLAIYLRNKMRKRFKGAVL